MPKSGRPECLRQGHLNPSAIRQRSEEAVSLAFARNGERQRKALEVCLSSRASIEAMMVV
jgi:hypothetical protein